MYKMREVSISSDIYGSLRSIYFLFTDATKYYFYILNKKEKYAFSTSKAKTRNIKTCTTGTKSQTRCTCFKLHLPLLYTTTIYSRLDCFIWNEMSTLSNTNHFWAIPNNLIKLLISTNYLPFFINSWKIKFLYTLFRIQLSFS